MYVYAVCVCLVSAAMKPGEEPHDGPEDVWQAAAQEAAARRHAQSRAGEGHHTTGVPCFVFFRVSCVTSRPPARSLPTIRSVILDT